MTPGPRNIAVLTIAIVVCLVGVVDAAAGRRWDELAVLVLLFALLALLLVRARGHRPPVPVRHDLVSWLIERSAQTGEPMERIADRAIAAYRAGLTEGTHVAGRS